MSLSAYARHRRVSPQAVSKEVKRGRLKESVRLVNGRPYIVNVATADAEWAAATARRPPAPAELRAAQRWGITRAANGNVAVVLFNDAEAAHDREYEDQFVAAAQAISELPPMGPDGYPDVFYEMTRDTARALAAALLEAAK